jgi:hypothetical protein
MTLADALEQEFEDARAYLLWNEVDWHSRTHPVVRLLGAALEGRLERAQALAGVPPAGWVFKGSAIAEALAAAGLGVLDEPYHGAIQINPTATPAAMAEAVMAALAAHRLGAR